MTPASYVISVQQVVEIAYACTGNLQSFRAMQMRRCTWVLSAALTAATVDVLKQHGRFGSTTSSGNCGIFACKSAL
eukprot:5470286-Amphidinium_carterae.1